MNVPAPDAIPPLRPPLQEIPPSFWEQHGAMIVAAGVLVIAALGAAVWFLTRPRKVTPPSAAAQARAILAPLRTLVEEGALLSRVSQVLRRYLAAAFALPPEELTTSEFCRALAAQPQVGAELSAAICQFLRRCDERKFAPQAGQPALGAVDQAMRFVSAAEERLARLSQEKSRSPEPGGRAREANT
jgi:Domain of unknown function (DUF4381)